MSTMMEEANAEHVTAIVDTLKTQFQHRLESLKADVTGLKNKQQQVWASGTVKLSKNVKNMTVREFNALHKTDILSVILSIQNEAMELPPTGKRDIGEMETPLPSQRSRRNLQTPSRTVRRGEMLYSENGSPLDTAEAGTLVATISKKARGANSLTHATNFDINVGEGKYISLTDPSGVNDLDDEMKNTALSQLKIL